MRIVPYVVMFAVALSAATARADDLSDRLSRIERDVNFLQRQVYRGGTPTDGTTGEALVTPVGVGGATLEVRLSQMNDEIRALRGQLEQVQFQTRQTSEELRKLSADIEYRFQVIEQKQAQLMPTISSHGQGFSPDADGTAPEATEAPTGASTKAAPTGKDFPDSNAHYTHAFKLLNDKNYAAAATSFDAFVKKYPNDPLASNAYYWLGESYYARSDYTRASEGFRKGYQANPEGEKAADNLLKLALSLAQVKRVSDACTVLTQIGDKYAQTNARTVARATAERTRLQCK